VINQVKPFGRGVKPKLGPTGTGYQPRGPFTGGKGIQGTWEAGIRSGSQRAQQIWGQKYRQESRNQMARIADQMRQAEIDRALRPGISWQPWKDPKRGFGGGRLPPSPTLTPIQGAQQAAKEGARKVGRKVAVGGASKVLGLGLKAVPILGEAIIIAQTAQEAVNVVDSLSDKLLEKIWEEMGLIPELGDNGTVPGGSDEFPEPEPLEPVPPEGFPIIPPYEESFEEEGEININDQRTGWYKAKIEYIYRSISQVYNLNLNEFSEVYPFELPRQTLWAWVRGPRQKFIDRYEFFFKYTLPDGYLNATVPYIAGTGYRRIHPDRLNTPPIYYDSNPNYRPILLGTQPQMIKMGDLGTTDWDSFSDDGYYFGDRQWRKGGIVVTIKWFTEDGNPEDGGELPAPVPRRKRREEEDDVADCPNIRPLLLQQTAMIEAKLQQQTADVNNIVAGLQAEIGANNSNLINAVNTAEANIAVDLTDVKNRLGPQIPDGISTKVSNHYDEFKNFLGEAWDNTKGTWDDFMTKFQEFSEKFDKLMKWLHIDRILNILIFITTVHNAYMLSANLTQTLISALNTITTVAGNALGLRDVEDAPIDFSEAINDTMENVLKGILGADNLENIKAEWKKYSRIYQAASHIMFAIQSINNSVLGAVELTSSNVAKIGNALKKWGAVSERAFGWMNPQPWMQNKFFTTIENLEDAGGTLDMVALETLSAQQEISQLTTQIEDFQKMAAQLDGGDEGPGSPEAQKIKAQEEAAKSGSSSVVE
jgi:hypothetical protein